jgi:hypothetical protein
MPPESTLHIKVVNLLGEGRGLHPEVRGRSILAALPARPSSCTTRAHTRRAAVLSPPPPPSRLSFGCSRRLLLAASPPLTASDRKSSDT